MVQRISDHPDARAATDNNTKLDKLAEHSHAHGALLTEIRDLLKRLVEPFEAEHTWQAAQKKQATDDAAKAKADEDRKKFDAQREVERRAQTAQPQNGLFGGAEDHDPGIVPPLQRGQSAPARNAEMAQQSDLEQQSQRDNVFHRDVQSKD